MITLDWVNFTPWSSLFGGAVIGVAAALLLLLNGHIAGVSGIVGGLLRPRRSELGWRAAFVVGLIAAPLLFQLFWTLPAVRIDASLRWLLLAGLLVGVGTRYGSGCTSGHGVCGVARWSPRSLAATAAFMLTGALTVFFGRHLVY